jgi:tetraacyldisaccharide 4'-kinase
MLQKQKKYFDLIAGQPMPGGRLLRFFLRAAAIPCSMVARFRNWLIDRRPGSVHGVGVPVISVGNMTTGGTGKTPVVALLVNQLAERSRRPGIVSRGYRSLSAEGNDEKRVLATLCPDVPHVQNRDRVEAARECVSKFQADILVADDGFQHRRLARDLDLVLVDALTPWGHGFVLPRGLLREPMSGLRRADLVILTRADQVSQQRRDEIWKQARRWCDLPGEVEVCFEPDELLDLDGRRTPLPKHEDPGGDRSSRKVLAFCGIGNPAGFRKTLEEADFDVVDLVDFPDHHHFSQTDIEVVAELARAAGCGLITTLKDLVKIGRAPLGVSLYALNIRARVSRGEDVLVARLEDLLTTADESPDRSP